MQLLRRKKRFFKVTFSLTILILLAMTATLLSAAPERQPVSVARVAGTITTGQLNYLSRQIDSAVRNDAQLLVVVLNTPGGLVDATLKINEAIPNAPVPVAVLGAPSRDRASAGAFIVYPPISPPWLPEPLSAQPIRWRFLRKVSAPADDKTTKFMANHLRSLAGEKGRPGDIAARFVTENLVLTAPEALRPIIDYIAADLNALLTELDGVKIDKRG